MMFLGEFLGVWAWGLFFFVGWREGRMDSLPAGRWMAARAEFPCGLTGGECGIGAALDALWVERVSIGAVVDAVGGVWHRRYAGCVWVGLVLWWRFC